MVECHAEQESVCQVSVAVSQAQQLCMEVAAGHISQLVPAQKALLNGSQHVHYVPRHITAFLDTGKQLISQVLLRPGPSELGSDQGVAPTLHEVNGTWMEEMMPRMRSNVWQFTSNSSAPSWRRRR